MQKNSKEKVYSEHFSRGEVNLYTSDEMDDFVSKLRRRRRKGVITNQIIVVFHDNNKLETPVYQPSPQYLNFIKRFVKRKDKSSIVPNFIS
jgi:hypothetical protein